VAILLTSLPKSYETLVTTLLVEKMTLNVDEVLTTLLETANMKKPSSTFHTEQVLVEQLDSNRERSKSLRRYYDKRDDRSKSRPIKDIECYYWHKKWHIKRNCEELTKYHEEKRKQEPQETSDSANVVDNRFDSEDGVYSVIADENIFDS